MQAAGESVPARATLLAHHLGERGDGRRAPRGPALDPFEQGEAVGNQHASG